MSISKKLKQIVKGVSEKPTFGTDPNDPWSAKANIAESGGLTDYLKAKGINPQFISKDTKISHAKSLEFAKWKKDHQFEEVEHINEDKYLDAYLLARGVNPKTATKEQKIAHAKSSAFLTWKRNHLHEQMATKTPVQKKQEVLDKKEKRGTPLQTEEVDGKDTITLDIPFMIRVLEYAREDAKDDMALHKVVEKLIDIRNKGTLTMDDYDFVTKIKEEYELSEGKMKAIATDKEEKSRLSAHERGGADAYYGRKYSNPHEVGSIEHKAYHQGYHGGEKDGKDYGVSKGAPKHSFRESALDKFREKAAERAKKHDKAEKEMKARHAAGKEDMKGSIERLAKALGEDIYQDSQAATQTNFDGANAPDNTEPQMPGLNRKREMSKSARIIKSIYNKLGMVKEELYDHEKEDKSVATYGKKPKLQQVDADKLKGDKAPEAAAVLSGGTTLTGQTRDTLEIDPQMKRPIRSGIKKQ